METFDHDFPSAAQGKLIPHSIYDLAGQHVAIHLNTSHDTGVLCCAAYPQAKSLLILCDGGGSNSASQYLFKENLQRLAERLQLELRVAHYSPYFSKHNPIEHRVFPHVSILNKVYQTGRQYAQGYKDNMQIVFDDHHPKWNHRALPQTE